MNKVCTSCGLSRPLTDYHPKPTYAAPSGTRARCRKCENAANRAAYASRRAAYLEATAEIEGRITR
jgi:nitrate/TMAO reductase-like tetraheme cytochrome c subunit